MTEPELIRCRLAACRDEGGHWSFHLINDSDFPLDEVVLYEVNYEWGDWGNSESTDVRITGLAPRCNARIWKDDGHGVELRMELCLRILHGGRSSRLKFGFPKLYRKRNLPMVQDLDRSGWEERGEARLS
jgi:hypothetical protein